MLRRRFRGAGRRELRCANRLRACWRRRRRYAWRVHLRWRGGLCRARCSHLCRRHCTARCVRVCSGHRLRRARTRCCLRLSLRAGLRGGRWVRYCRRRLFRNRRRMRLYRRRGDCSAGWLRSCWHRRVCCAGGLSLRGPGWVRSTRAGSLQRRRLRRDGGLGWGSGPRFRNAAGLGLLGRRRRGCGRRWLAGEVGRRSGRRRWGGLRLQPLLSLGPTPCSFGCGAFGGDDEFAIRQHGLVGIFGLGPKGSWFGLRQRIGSTPPEVRAQPDAMLKAHRFVGSVSAGRSRGSRGLQQLTLQCFGVLRGRGWLRRSGRIGRRRRRPRRQWLRGFVR